MSFTRNSGSPSGVIRFTGPTTTPYPWVNVRCSLIQMRDCRCAYESSRVESMSCLYAHRSEEHTSELQSRSDLVCRLLLENKRQHALTGLASGFLASPWSASQALFSLATFIC